jgi:dienelactone hydrolase
MRCADAGRVLFVGSAAVLLIAITLHAAAPRRVTFRAEDGATLAAAYYEPSRRPAPAILLLHMLKRSHSDWDAVASHLSDSGFAVLALDFRSSENLGTYAADVRAAKAFLRDRPEVSTGRLGIAGASIGANLALIDAADDPGVVSIALLSPGVDYRGLRTEAAIKKYGSRPALLMASTRDPYAARSIRLMAAIGPGTREVKLSDAIAHGTMLLTRDPSITSALVDWFQRTL